MKFKKTFLLQKFTYKTIIVLIFFFSLQFINAQKNDSTIVLNKNKKNSIKGAFVYLGPLAYQFFHASAGYERSISRQHTMEFAGNYINIRGEWDERLEMICIMLGYKYVVFSEKKIFNNTWYSGYLAYFKGTYYSDPDYEYDEGPDIYYMNGIGCAVGRKMYFSKSENWFMEIGLGISFNVFNIKPISSHSCDPIPFLPRPILQIGGRF
jgi:hypothetical protein